MKKYKIVVAYDGTDFHGWQIQPSDITIVSELQRTFCSVFSKEISILGASRTDAGVHALGQVALFSSDLDIACLRMMNAWNNCLPNSIVIRSLEVASDDFHIFTGVMSKTYYYHLFINRPLPHIARYGWFWNFIDDVDFSKFEKALQFFVGTHDFRSFSKNEDDKSTIRTVDTIKVLKIEKFGVIRIEVTGKGFLRYQIRRMIGAALDVSRKRDVSHDVIREKLKNPSDQQEFVKAEGSGLCLRKIVYRPTMREG